MSVVTSLVHPESHAVLAVALRQPILPEPEEAHLVVIDAFRLTKRRCVAISLNRHADIVNAPRRIPSKRREMLETCRKQNSTPI
ncbi:hypothetical protein [Martelella soudanensis]|uniref:hypothetical protein n=1 Tax=unclassified Martelella TaxID=2629616 RepID=UPI0015DF6EDB|nr:MULTISPECIES: hypothetical protein [unclassified Martelella]